YAARLATALIQHGPCDRLRLVERSGGWNGEGGNSMSYIEKNLVPGETVVYQTRLHWVVMLWHIVLSVLLLELPALGMLFYAFTHQDMEPRTLHLMQGGGIALLLISGIVIAAGAIRRNATEMAVTNRRVVVKTGLAARKTIEMLLNKIESIEVTE